MVLPRLFCALGLLLASAMMTAPRAEAEPWLANRYAQNCAACHSPGRRNVATRDRRCTLSCKGCHVNPNGGGMRNTYGMWNQQRWLRSFKSELFRSKGTPAPARYQKYSNEPEHPSPTDTEWHQMAKEGAKLVVLPDVEYNPKDYDRHEKQDAIEVNSMVEFLARVTEDDPYRVERRESVFAGAEYRYFYIDSKYNRSGPSAAPSSSTNFIGPMALDLAVRARPIPEKLQIVAESRYYNIPGPGDGSLQWSVIGGNAPRSFYALSDDWAYNSYVMYGLYNPLFGYSDPNHNSLLNTLVFADNINDSYDTISQRSAVALYKALTVGASPGGSPSVPFVNVHYIMPMDTGTDVWHRDTGYAFNLGARFVNYGLSFMLSYWDTKGPRGATQGGPNLENNMYGLTAGFSRWNLVGNVDFTTIKREFAPGQSDSGSVQTLDLKYRFWREMYAELNYATSNVARNLKDGKGTDISYGVKTYLYPGTEFELMMVSRDDVDNVGGNETKSTVTQAQIHAYF